MDKAYAGQPDGDYEVYVQNVAQNMMQQLPQETYTEAALPADDVAAEVIFGIGDAIGYWPLLGLVILGAVFFFKKRLKKIIKEWVTDAK
jgi:hypothetical protein